METKEEFERQIKGLILIMSDESGFVARSYILEKLRMILNKGIGFHPSIIKRLDMLEGKNGNV